MAHSPVDSLALLGSLHPWLRRDGCPGSIDCRTKQELLTACQRLTGPLLHCPWLFSNAAAS